MMDVEELLERPGKHKQFAIRNEQCAIKTGEE